MAQGGDHHAAYCSPVSRARDTGEAIARRLNQATELTKLELALQMLNRARQLGISALYLLVDAWFTSPKFFQPARELHIHAIGRLKQDHTRYEHKGDWYTLDQLYQKYKNLLVKEPELGLSLVRAPMICGNGLPAAIVLTKGYKEPPLEVRPQNRRKAEPAWTVFLSIDLTLSPVEVVKKYIGRWSIEVFFEEAKQRLGLGKEQGQSLAVQAFSITLAVFRYSLLAYLVEQEAQPQTIGDMFRQLGAESGALTYQERLWQYFTALLKNCLDTLTHFYTGSSFRDYLDIIANTFNNFCPLQGCET